MKNVERRIYVWIAVFLSVAVLAPLASGQSAGLLKNRIIGVMGTMPDGTAEFTLVNRPSPVPVVQNSALLPAGLPARQIGVITLPATGSIRLLNTSTFALYGPFFAGELGTIGGQILDVELNKNGTTALVSNFGDGKVFFLDLSRTFHPRVSGEVQLSFFAEDITLAANDNFALVTDGGFSPNIASINVKTKKLVQGLDLTPYGAYPNTVAVANYNHTVITGSYFNGYCDFLRMNPLTGRLAYRGTIDVLPARPIDVVISPVGNVALALSFNVDSAVQGFGPLLSITGPGAVAFGSWLPAPGPDVVYGYSATFSPDARKLYILGGPAWSDPVGYEHFVYVYNVSAAGKVRYTGQAIQVYGFENSNSAFFGVDSMACSSDGNWLFVSNHTFSGATNTIAVVSLRRLKHTMSLAPGATATDVPVGIAFNN